jgi:hypothetical protein
MLKCKASVCFQWFAKVSATNAKLLLTRKSMNACFNVCTKRFLHSGVRHASGQSHLMTEMLVICAILESWLTNQMILSRLVRTSQERRTQCYHSGWHRRLHVPRSWHCSPALTHIVVSSTASKAGPKHKQPAVHCVSAMKTAATGTGHSLAPSAEIKNAWSYIFTPHTLN